MTPLSTVIIEGIEYNLVPKSESKRDWEILKCTNADGVHDFVPANDKTRMSNCVSEGCAIHSVKRLSDGEVFTIGDEIALTWYPDFNKGLIVIKEFEIINGKMYARYDETSKYELRFIRLIEKAPSPTVEREPILITEDGWGVHDGDIIWQVGILEGSWKVRSTKARKEIADVPSYFKYFSSEEKANEYVNLNKPVLSVSDIHTALVLLSQVNERDINKYDYNEQLNKSIWKLAQQKINP